MSVRLCSKCNQSKPITEFYPKMGRCKNCHNLKMKEWRQANPDKARAAVDRYQNKPEKKILLAAAAKRWRNDNRERYQTTKLKNDLKKYGLTLENYQHLVEAQDGRCAICGNQPKRLHIDHDHASNVVRSLLCHHCNTAIGLFKESPEVLEKAIKYLAQHSSTSIQSR